MEFALHDEGRIYKNDMLMLTSDMLVLSKNDVLVLTSDMLMPSKCMNLKKTMWTSKTKTLPLPMRHTFST